MTLQFPLEAGPRQAVFQYVPKPAGATEQDFVAAALDIRPLQDKEMSVTLDFSGLTGSRIRRRPLRRTTTTSRSGRTSVQAALLESDRDAVKGQRTCPVSGGAVGQPRADRKGLRD